jgi:hypothetical protein
MASWINIILSGYYTYTYSVHQCNISFSGESQFWTIRFLLDLPINNKLSYVYTDFQYLLSEGRSKMKKANSVASAGMHFDI